MDSIWLTDVAAKGVLYFWSGWSFQCQSEGFWEGSGSERQYMFVDATSLDYLYV